MVDRDMYTHTSEFNDPYVCILLCTRDRPEMLRRCIGSLPFAIEHANVPTSVVVVENSIENRCKSIVEDFRSTIDIHYVQEKTLGIPYARNCGIEKALELGFAWLILIDDDEWVEKNWLSEFLKASTKYDAQVFTGPVVRVYPDGTPDWIIENNHTPNKTGTTLSTTYSGNTMAAASLFKNDKLALRFDTRLRFSGGEDMELFQRFSDLEGKIIWVEEARVLEEFPSSRATFRWHWNRNVQYASGGILVQRLQNKPLIYYSIRRIVHCLLRVASNWIKALLLVIKSPNASKIKFIRGILAIASVYGYVLGLLKIKVNPYKKVDGR